MVADEWVGWATAPHSAGLPPHLRCLYLPALNRLPQVAELEEQVAALQAQLEVERAARAAAPVMPLLPPVAMPQVGSGWVQFWAVAFWRLWLFREEAAGAAELVL